VRNIIGRSGFLLKFADNSAKPITISTVDISIDPYQLVIGQQPALKTRIGDPLGPVLVLFQDYDGNNVTMISDPDDDGGSAALVLSTYRPYDVTPGLVHWDDEDVTWALNGATVNGVSDAAKATFTVLSVARKAGTGLYVTFTLDITSRTLSVRTSQLTVYPAELVSYSPGAQAGVINSPAQISSVQDSILTTITVNLRNSTDPPIGLLSLTARDVLYLTARLLRGAEPVDSCASKKPGYNDSNDVDYTNTTLPCLGGRTKILAVGGTVIFTDLVVRNVAGLGFTLRFDVAGAGTLLDPALTTQFIVFPGDLKILRVSVARLALSL
jgi:hypothetical protein